MSGFLSGIRVVELAAHGVGPMTGLILEQFGADVIKIERPVTGDPTRGFNRTDVRKTRPGGHTLTFEFTNRGKKSVTLDLTKEKGREIAVKLLKNSDVFITNYLPEGLKQLGFDYETLSKSCPRLVYAASSSYGKFGPEANKGSFDSLALARSGIMLSSGEPDSPPTEVRGMIADCSTGVFLVLAVVSGLLTRERLGRGQEINTSLFGSLIWLQFYKVSQLLMGVETQERESRAKASNPLTNNYKCKDGRWLKIQAGAGADSTMWPDYCRALGLESLEKDPGYESAVARLENNEELVKILDKVFLGKNRAEWVKHFKAMKPRFFYENINTVAELSSDPQVVANNFIVDDNHPDLGNIKMVQFPMQFSETAAEPIRKPAPLLGDSTERILQELGYSQKEISELKNQKVI